MQCCSWKVVALGVLCLALARASVFGVDETEFVVLTTFGKPAGTLRSPGLRFKLPWQTRRSFDRRLAIYRFGRLPFYTQDKKAIELDLFLIWRVVEPLKFLQTVGDVTGAELRLHNVGLAEATHAVGNLRLAHLINTDKAELLASQERFGSVTRAADATARRHYGIEVMEVGVQRLAFPEQNKAAVFARMRAERERIARQYRAEGQEQALRIRSEADREKERIVSEAYRDAERTRGEGDAESTRIYGAAHAADPEFYRMTRTLDAYRKVLDKDTTAILAADSELLRLLTKGR